MEKSKRSNEDARNENDKLFLEKNQVRENVSELLAILVANRPDEPLKFISDYFRSSFEQSNRLERSYQTILLTHHSRPAFQRNLSIAFELLNQTRIAKHVQGINGALYSDLLGLLLQDLPPAVTPEIKSKLSWRSHEAVSFEAFHYGVSSVMIFKDYINMANQLFQLLNTSNSDQIDRAYAENLITLLKSSFADLTSNSSQRLQACYSLSPHGLISSLSTINKRKNHSAQQLLSHEEFLELCTHAFMVLIDLKTKER